MDLREAEKILSITDSDAGVAKTLGVQWDTRSDSFRLATSEFKRNDVVTKRLLLSDISRVFDALGWFAPATVKMKILLQRMWELNVGWDERIPDDVRESWESWRADLSMLTSTQLERCYFLKTETLEDAEIHGFSDASEEAYAAVAYLRSKYTSGKIHVSLIMAKTKVAPIKRQSVPRLELCGALMLSRILKRLEEVLKIPVSNIYAWTDSTIVLDWLCGNPRRFKTFVGNRVSEIMDTTPTSQWRHVPSRQNPADCASRGLSPAELLQHELWWKGPPWLLLDVSSWPNTERRQTQEVTEECRISLTSVVERKEPIIPFNKFSDFTKLVRVIAWILRFVQNATPNKEVNSSIYLTAIEIRKAERYLLAAAQEQDLQREIAALKAKKKLPRSSNLKHLFPFLDDGLVRAGGRIRNSEVNYEQKHPVILRGDNSLTKLLIKAEHIRLLHAGPARTFNSLSGRFHLIGGIKVVRSITRKCVTCRRLNARSSQQLVGQLPRERVTPGQVFDHVGVDYAGPFLLKLGHVRRPVVVKAYICVFVSMSVKAVHLEVVSDLTAEAFISTLKRFVARRGLPAVMFSDNGTNFVGANNLLKEFFQFLNQQEVQSKIADSCSRQMITWKFIPEHSPHFGGLWEAAVKSVKIHLRKIVGSVKLTYEELSTVLTQIEASLNSRPLTYMSNPDGDGVEPLTPGHFLIGKPLCALPERDVLSAKNPRLLKRWQLCEYLVQHFWRRWSREYINTLRKFYKWHDPTRNLKPGDVVILREDGVSVNNWPLGRIQEAFPGDDGLVRVATVKTAKGTYKRPAVKMCLLLEDEMSWPAGCSSDD